MTVLERRTTRARRAGVGVGSYLVVGAVALVVGMLAALGLQHAGVTSGPSQEVSDRGTAATAHLAGLWESGLAQQAAIHEQRLLQGRIEAGVAQQQAITQQHSLLPGRIEAGRAQQQAIRGVDGFADAWTLRGAEMSSHRDDLIESGHAQQAAISGN